MNYSHVIWDFNGTILDDTAASIKSENVLLSRRNMPLIDNREHYHRLFCFPVIEYYKKLGHDLEQESYDKLSVEWVEQYLKYSKLAALHDGVLDMLIRIQQAQIPQIILSATEIAMLRSQVETLGITCYFSELLALDNIYAHSKIEIAREWISRTKPRKAILIGDTVHDYEVACEMGVECVLIANGHQGKDSLTGLGVPVYNNMRELLVSEWI